MGPRVVVRAHMGQTTRLLLQAQEKIKPEERERHVGRYMREPSGGVGQLRALLLLLALGLTTACCLFRAAPAAAGADGEETVPAYVGEKACADCHGDVAEAWDKVPHAVPLRDPERPVSEQGCEACHGPGSKHVDTADPADIINFLKIPARAHVEAEACLKCHQTATHSAIYESIGHGAQEVPCSGCHVVHATTEFKAYLKDMPPALCYGCHQYVQSQFGLYSHHPVNEGIVACNSCHNPMGGVEPPMMIKEKAELCISCHEDKAGPFVFQHEATDFTLGNGCLSCHQAHGSPNPRLWRLPGRSLCLQCHADRAGHAIVPTPEDCWECHSAVHGSNASPQLFF